MRDQGAMMTEESLSQNRSHTKIEGNIEKPSGPLLDLIVMSH
jgi:hypothetical protein